MAIEFANRFQGAIDNVLTKIEFQPTRRSLKTVVGEFIYSNVFDRTFRERIVEEAGMMAFRDHEFSKEITLLVSALPPKYQIKAVRSSVAGYLFKGLYARYSTVSDQSPDLETDTPNTKC